MLLNSVNLSFTLFMLLLYLDDCFCVNCKAAYAIIILLIGILNYMILRGFAEKKFRDADQL